MGGSAEEVDPRNKLEGPYALLNTTGGPGAVSAEQELRELRAEVMAAQAEQTKAAKARVQQEDVVTRQTRQQNQTKGRVLEVKQGV